MYIERKKAGVRWSVHFQLVLWLQVTSCCGWWGGGFGSEEVGSPSQSAAGFGGELAASSLRGKAFIVRLRCLIITFQIQERKGQIGVLAMLDYHLLWADATLLSRWCYGNSCRAWLELRVSLTFPLIFFSVSLSLSVCVALSFSLFMKVTDSSVKRSNGTAGCMIARKNLKELQTCISHLRELGHTSAELLNQVRSHYIRAVCQRV